MKEERQGIPLPEAIAAYWKAANAGAIDDAAGCFAADGMVHDEGRTHRGLSAIRSWIESTTRKYHPVVEPLQSEEREGRHFVTARVSGTFPGSPVELEFVFTLRDGRIVHLEIQ
jgi:ketosteroid isomerase-like protein